MSGGTSGLGSGEGRTSLEMKVRLYRSAVGDLNRARRFYEQHDPGLGEHFLNHIFREIDSLAGTGGIHRTFEDIIG
jgi:hypothetical protein